MRFSAALSHAPKREAGSSVLSESRELRAYAKIAATSMRYSFGLCASQSGEPSAADFALQGSPSRRVPMHVGRSLYASVGGTYGVSEMYGTAPAGTPLCP